MGKNVIRVEGYWKFDESIDDTILDTSGNSYDLMITGKPNLVKENKLEGGVSLDGATQWLSTKKPVLRTDQSYSIAAWVYLNSSVMNEKFLLRKAEHSFALTAVSQDSPTHCAFYLGIRRIEWLLPDGAPTGELRWLVKYRLIEYRGPRYRPIFKNKNGDKLLISNAGSSPKQYYGISCPPIQVPLDDFNHLLMVKSKIQAILSTRKCCLTVAPKKRGKITFWTSSA